MLFRRKLCSRERPFWRLRIKAVSLALQDPAMARAVASARSRLRDVLTGILTDARADWAPNAPRATALRLEAMRNGLAGLLPGADTELGKAMPKPVCNAFSSAKPDKTERSRPRLLPVHIRFALDNLNI
ncbi:TetR family transcriptional regulator C-terminal domain-containing protein [Paracoccus sp. (in: a-proteobacteria)]|uniref:TetR family transcriptional regulator C-terminal domain-containing protein n=1 Tax=Paracoccus sp. TaxID=267 RepID=UPI003A87B93F